MSVQKLSKSQIEAKEYVDKHKLDKIISEMLNSLIYNKCEFPTIFMIKFLASKLNDSELKAVGIFIKSTSERSSESQSNHAVSEPETISQQSEENKEISLNENEQDRDRSLSSSSSSSSSSGKRKSAINTVNETKIMEISQSKDNKSRKSSVS